MNKLTMRDIIGYGPAAFGDAAAYSIVCTFLLFFLTTVAGIRPATAGTIVAIGAVTNAILSLVMGYISDNINTRWGRRVPFMVLFGILQFFSMVLLFTSIDAVYLIRIVYYLVFVILFYISYTGFFVPYLALGAEFTQDYQDRTKLRSYAAFFNMIGSMTSMVVPSTMVDYLGTHGFTESQAWSITAGSIGFLATISILITAHVAQKFDVPQTDRILDAPGISFRQMIWEYRDVLKLKPIIPLLFASLFFLISYGIFISDMLYFFTFNLGMSSGKISLLLLYRCLAGIVIIPLITWIAQLTDKRIALILLQVICALVIIAYGFLGVHGTVSLIIFVFFLGISTVVYWQVMPAIIYDVCEYDQLETGRQRQGTIVSIQGLVESISMGVGTQILGIILQLAGFNGEAATQPDTALVWIQHCTTFVPTIFLLLSCVALWKYPITKKVYEDILRKLKDQEQ